MAAQVPPPKCAEVAVTELLNIPEIQELLTSSFPNNDDYDGNRLLENKSEEIGLEDEEPQRQVPQKAMPDGFDAEMQELQDDEDQEPIYRPIPRSITSWAELDTAADTQLTGHEKTGSSASQRLHNSAVSITGRQIRGLNEVESEELRLKVQRRTTSLRSRNAEQEKVRRQKKQIRELQAELAHLQDVEGQLKAYEGRSVESLESELGGHKDEVASLSVQLQLAAEEEMDWDDNAKQVTLDWPPQSSRGGSTKATLSTGLIASIVAFALVKSQGIRPIQA